MLDGPPVMPEDPYAYVVAAFQAPPSPDYVPGAVRYPTFTHTLFQEADYILSCVPESDLEEDPANYPADGGDDGDDEDESSDDDEE
ncbi:hypothetical protein Tco_0343534 [Tanacetum coccineum]